MNKATQRRKIISVVMAALMLLNLLSATQILTAFADGNQLEVGWTLSKTTAKPGDVIDVTISLNNYSDTSISGIAGMQIEIPLDTSKVSYVAGSAGNKATLNAGGYGAADYNGLTNKLVYLYDRQTSDGFLPRTNGNLFSFQIKVLDTLATDSNMGLNFSALDFFDENIDMIGAPSTSSPSISIMATKPEISLNGATPTGTSYTNDVAITFDKGTATVAKDGGAATAITSGYVASGNGSYVVTAADSVGNTSSASFSIQLATTSIAMKTNPTKMNYTIGTSLSPAGGVVEVTYSNGSKAETALTAAMCDVTNVGDTIGGKTITVSYGGKTTTFDINVVDKLVTSIAMKSNPTKTAYIEGQDLDLAGAKITVSYDNDTTTEVDVTTAMVSGYNKNTAGTQTVTVTYEGKTTTYPITVTAKSVVSIAVTTQPKKTEYIEGNTFDKTGMVVTATYDNGTSGAITGYTVAPTQLDLSTTQVTVTYSGKTAMVDVVVKPKTLTGIVLDISKAQTTYFEGSDLDIAGLVVVASYDNDTSERIPAEESMVSGYDSSILGNQAVTVTYNGKMASYTVKVISRKSVDDLISAIEQLNISSLTVKDEAKVFDLQDIYDALSEFEKAAITNKAKLDEAITKMNILLHPPIKDKVYLNGAVKINADAGVVPHDATLKVVATKVPANALANIQAIYGADSYFIVIHEFTLANAQGNLIQPNLKAGKLSISVKFPEEHANGTDLVVVYVAENGDIEILEGVFENGFVTFQPLHFSTYGVVKPAAATADASQTETGVAVRGGAATPVTPTSAIAPTAANAPKTGDGFPMEFWFSMLLVSAVGILLLVLKEKRISK